MLAPSHESKIHVQATLARSHWDLKILLVYESTGFCRNSEINVATQSCFMTLTFSQNHACHANLHAETHHSSTKCWQNTRPSSSEMVKVATAEVCTASNAC